MGHHDHGQKDHHSHSTHGEHEGGHAAMIAEFRNLFFLAMVLTVPILVLSPMVQDWFGFSFRFTGDRFVLFGLSTVVYAYCGKPFLVGSWSELRAR